MGAGPLWASAVGIELGTLAHVCAAAIGLSAALRSSAAALSTLKWLGVVHLAYLGITSILSGPNLSDEGPQPTEPNRRVLLRGMVVNVLNPKVSLFFLAFLAQFVDPD